MFEEWAGKAIPGNETASICFRNPEWNDESAHINHMDENAQQKNNVADNKLQDKKNEIMPIYPKLNPGDRIKILPYELQPNKSKKIWPEKWQKLCGCFVTIKEYDEIEHGYLIEETNNYGWFPNEFDYSTLIKAENIQGDQKELNSNSQRLFPGDKIMIKPFEQQPRNDVIWCFDAKSICGKVVTIKDYDKIKEIYYVEEIYYSWCINEFDFDTLIRANTNNYQDITNPTQKDFNNLQPGDMVLLKSITECNAECWSWYARNCCGNLVTVQSRTNERMYFAIKEDSDDKTYVKFEWISAIRKKV